MRDTKAAMAQLEEKLQEARAIVVHLEEQDAILVGQLKEPDKVGTSEFDVNSYAG